MSSKPTIAVVLSAYIGLTRVARITLARYDNQSDADRFYNLIREAGTDKTDALKSALIKFFDAYLVFVIEKEIH